ncbi:unnamed protein product [Lactuca virosa]|uniref:Uncharacterized protein n=1 Tax=Lactuca virosa TaxID=75947 RepID=A0AAU9LE39_9ASTR|nr:unnamed protein product [Lactuca virosa]
MRRVFTMNNCKELMQEYLGSLEEIVDTYDLPVNNNFHEMLQQNKILQGIRKKHIEKYIEMFNEIIENKKEGKAVVIANDRNSAQTPHSELIKDGRFSEAKESKEGQIEVHLLGWGIAKALVKFKKADGSSDRYLPPCLSINENGKTDESVKMNLGIDEQVGGISISTADHYKDEDKIKGPTGRIRMLYIIYYPP